MAGQPSLTLPEFMAVGPIRRLTRQRLLGGPYVPLGGIIGVLAYLFENCALLGRACRTNIDHLITLVTEPWTDRAAFLAMLRQVAGERLRQYHALQGEEPHHLWRLIQVTEFAKIDIQLPKRGEPFGKRESRALERAWGIKFPLRDSGKLASLVTLTGCEGIGFGVRYPEKTWRLSENFRLPVDTEEWERAYRAGVVDSLNHDIDSVEEAECVALALARLYITEHRPDLAGSI